MLILGGSLGGIIGGGKRYVPTDDGADLAFWYDAEQYSGAASMAQWDDLSTNARHIVQATGTNQPTYGATSFKGTRPGVTFAVNKIMRTSAAITLNTFKAIFVVADFIPSNSGILMEHGSNGFLNAGFYLLSPANPGNGPWSVNDGAAAQYAVAGTGGLVDGVQNISFEYGSSGGVVKAGGAPITPAPSITGSQRSNTAISAVLNIGCRTSLAFAFAGIVNTIYCLNREATAQDINNFLSFASTRA